jgi:membrane fusion protein, heavy metal efflux system
VNVNWKSRPAIVSAVVAAAAVAATLFALRDRFETSPKETEERKEEAAAGSDVVELSGGKLAAADIKTIVVRRGELTHGHVVPGRINYDETQHVEVRTPADGVLTKVVVNPGDRVAAGDVLAWVTSREIGTARADVLKRQGERDLAVTWLKLKQSLAVNVATLVADLSKRLPFDTIQRKHTDQHLCDYRAKLLPAYSRHLLAAALQKSISGLDRSGAIAGKLALQQVNELRTADAGLEAACEESKHDSERERDVARVAASDAERRLKIAQQHLASLLMTPGMVDGTANGTRRTQGFPKSLGSETAPSGEADLESLSRLAIRAPISGTIEARKFTAGERLKQSDSLFVLAETSRLWIKADLRENEWSALNLAVGQKLHVTSPAFPGKAFTARVYQLGRQVSMETNSIPLIAEIDNLDGKLRPGLFVRVTLPVAAERDALFVPESALMQHEGVSFVFVQLGKGRFRRVNVKAGITSGRQVAVLSGLQGGDRIVTQGAFTLKSEMLLEREE